MLTARVRLVAIAAAVTIVAAAALPSHAAVQEGDRAPAISAKDQFARTVGLKDYQDHKYVVLYFYPKDFTGGCTLQAKRFAEDYAKFATRDAVVVGVSADPVESHERFCAEYNLPFVLLADTDRSIAKAFGVGDGHARRSTFLIDKSGKVAHVVSEVKDIQGHNQVLLEQLDQLGAKDVGPQVGQKAPEVLQPKVGDQKPWALSSLKGRKPVVLTFYRGWIGKQCPICIEQTREIHEVADQFEKAGVQVVSVYPGSQEKAREFLEKAGLKDAGTIWLVDESMQAAYAYGVVKEDRKSVTPATFVIDKAGTVRWAHIGKDATDRPDVEKVLTEARKAAATLDATTMHPGE